MNRAAYCRSREVGKTGTKEAGSANGVERSKPGSPSANLRGTSVDSGILLSDSGDSHSLHPLLLLVCANAYEYKSDNLMASCSSSTGLFHQAVPQAKSTGIKHYEPTSQRWEAVEPVRPSNQGSPLGR